MRAYYQQVQSLGTAGNLNRRLESSMNLDRNNPMMDHSGLSAEVSGKFSVIANLENRVTMIQIAKDNIEKIAAKLIELKKFLEQSDADASKMTVPPSVVNNYMTDRLAKIKEIAETARFQEQILLNGDCGVVGATSNGSLRFISGGEKVITSNQHGYPVTIFQDARPGTLLGNEVISEKALQKETLIALADGQHEMRYRVSDNEGPETIVENLQRSILKHGLNVRITKTRDNRLLFVHNQLGTNTELRGLSYKTKLLSSTPGIIKEATPGRDISGTIGLETAKGMGGFLMGHIGNRRTDGLLIYYDGTIKYPGEIVGYVRTIQQGVSVPVDLTGETMELLVIPPVFPENLAIGIGNSSGFNDLASIRGNTIQERQDALKLIQVSLEDLDTQLETIRWKEDKFVKRTINILQGTMIPKKAGEEILFDSTGEIHSMTEQLQEMLDFNLPDVG